MTEYGAVVRARAVRDLERSVTLSDSDHLRGQLHDPTGTIRGVQRDARRRVKEGEREGASEQDDRFPTSAGLYYKGGRSQVWSDTRLQKASWSNGW